MHPNPSLHVAAQTGIAALPCSATWLRSGDTSKTCITGPKLPHDKQVCFACAVYLCVQGLLVLDEGLHLRNELLQLLKVSLLLLYCTDPTWGGTQLQNAPFQNVVMPSAPRIFPPIQPFPCLEQDRGAQLNIVYSAPPPRVSGGVSKSIVNLVLCVQDAMCQTADV